jgi:HK97 family phage prohead protease
MEDIKFKSNTGQFNIDQAQGIVECFVAGIGNRDSVGDIVTTGAFAKSLLRRKPRVVWGHNWNDPIGKVLEIYEVPANDPRLPSKMKTAGIGGLYARVQFNLNSEKGREAFANVAFFGEEQEWSIGYKTLDAIYDNSRQANVLREVELYEVSPVLHGANQLTGTISVKSDDEKMHMMGGMGGPGVAVVEKPRGPVDPFAQGVAQPADSDRAAALGRELATRTGGPIKIMKASDSSVVFMKPGKGVFRLAYYFDGEQWMFGKPEKMGSAMMVVSPGGMMPNAVPRAPGGMMPNTGPRAQRVPNFPNVQAKPSVTGPVVPVKYGNDAAASGFFDLDDEKSLTEENGTNIVEQISGIIGSLQDIIGRHQLEKTEFLIPCKPQHAFETKQALDPVFDYHGIDTHITEDGIVIISPLDGDAYEAVENATKSLLGRIGRGIGGGGKVRRGRAALSRIEGVLDPRKRRDHDGDGLIFDGTWMERPAPNRTQVFAARSSLRSSSNNPTPTPLAAPGEKPPRLDISLTRTEQAKILKTLDAVIGENQLSADNPITRLRDEIKNSKKIGERLQPQLFAGEGDSLLEAAKAEFEKMKPSFDRHGAKEPGKKGRATKEIIEGILADRKYGRTNIDKRAKGGVGGASAREGVAVGTRENVAGTDEKLPTLGKMRKDGSLDVDDFIKKGYLPENWYKMSGEEKIDWLNSPAEGAGVEGDNESALVALRPRQFKWQQTIQRIKDEIFDQEFREADPEEYRRTRREERFERTRDRAGGRTVQEGRLEKLREQKVRDAAKSKKRDEDDKKKASASKKPEPKEIDEDRFQADPQRPQTKRNIPVARKSEKRLDKIKTYLEEQKRKGKIDKSLADLVDDAITDADLLLADEDGYPTLESLRDARDRLERFIRLTEDPDFAKKTKKTKKRDETGKEVEEEEVVSTLTVAEEEVIRGLKTTSGDLSEHIVDSEDEEGELDAESDLIDRAGRSGERAEDSRYDFDEYDGGDDGGAIESTRNYNQTLRSSGATTRSRDLSSVMQEARQYQTSLARRRSSGSLRSSGGKEPRTEIIKESTWWKSIDSSIKREIDKAPNDIVKNGLMVLQQKISKYQAGKFVPGSKRTNVGSIKITAQEADEILDAVMSVIDRQMSAGKGGTAGSRGEIFAELLEAVSSAAMSTFIDKTGSPSD